MIYLIIIGDGGGRTTTEYMQDLANRVRQDNIAALTTESHRPMYSEVEVE